MGTQCLLTIAAVIHGLSGVTHSTGCWSQTLASILTAVSLKKVCGGKMLTWANCLAAVM